MLRGLDGFEQRASLKTWLFRILTYQARDRAAREKRIVPFSSLTRGSDGGDDAEAVVDADRFQGEDGCWPQHWATPPRPWSQPHVRLAAMEAREQIRNALATLSPRQRLVVGLRDIEGFSSAEVCEILELSESNQRVLLHRGRAAIRNVLEEYIDG